MSGPIFMQPLLSLFLFLLLPALAGSAAAQARPGQDPAQRLQNEQRERQRDQETRQPAARIALPQPQSQSQPDDEPDAAAASIDSVVEDGAVFGIARILLQGDQGFIERTGLQDVVAPFRGKQLGAKRIALLLGRLSAALVGSGHVTSRAYLGAHNLAEGELCIAMWLDASRPSTSMAPGLRPIRQKAALTLDLAAAAC